MDDEPIRPGFITVAEFLETFADDVALYTLLHRKMSRKKFKKWLMKHGFERNFAEKFCQIIGSFHGRVSYMRVYISSPYEPTPHTLHHSITLEIHKLYGLYEGVKEPWTKK